MELSAILDIAIKEQTSDVHLQHACPPRLRRAGELVAIEGAPITTNEHIQEWLRQIGPGAVQVRLDEEGEADFSFQIGDRARFRANAFRQNGDLALALRQIPLAIPPFDELNLPGALREIAQVRRGLVLVTGTTGSGKSTTLAAIIDAINSTRQERIITVEDPIEFLHASKSSLVAQRELETDTRSFLKALRVALRQDPDVILLGELRDAETTRTAMQAADTGHVVFSTMHTTNAAQTVQRIIALFPAEERELVLIQLAENLEAVVCQRLAKAIDGVSRVPVVEIMRSSPTIKKLLRKGDWASVPQAIANQESGMQLFDQHLAMLWQAEIVSGREALRLATNPEALTMIMKGVSTRDLGAGLVGD